MVSLDLERRTKNLFRAYAGSISVDEEGTVKYAFWTNPLLKPFYKHFWRYYIIGWKTVRKGRDSVVDQGVLCWDIGMEFILDNEFVIQAVKTKTNSDSSVLKRLLSEAEHIAKLKGFKDMYGYSAVFKPKLAKRYGWESFWRPGSYLFRKKFV